MLSQVYEQNMALIDHVHSSDLQRSVDTAFYALGFPSNEDLIKQSRELREMNFGDTEGLHFDGLSASEKQEISSHDYHAPGGESWTQVMLRQQKFFSTLPVGNHLVFTHGGPIATLLYDFGVESMPSSGSIFGVTLDDKNIENGEI